MIEITRPHGSHQHPTAQKFPDKPLVRLYLAALGFADRAPPQGRKLFDVPTPSLGSVYLAIELCRFDRSEKPRDTGRAIDIDHDWHRRRWNMREKARAIIEGRRDWPDDLLHFRTTCEFRYFHRGRGNLPPWCDADNLTPSPRKGRLPSMADRVQRARRQRGKRR